ncbi:MAG: Hpt domain-containing protein [Proteobacteria bacterium]|nr:Hpt domain-containing protein [Pseudomonadota bacterium]
MDLTKYEDIFTRESERYLDELDDLLMRVEKDLFNRDLWREIHGKIHSIKGMARALSLTKISEFSHSMENWCQQFQKGTMTATANSVQLLFDGAELLRFLVVKTGDIESSENQRWYNSLTSKFEKSPEESANEVRSEKEPYCSRVNTAERIDHVRVKFSLIEELLGHSQEILLLEKTLPPLAQEDISAGIKNWIDHYSSMLKGLYFRLAQLRLMSVGDFADLFVKTIRNLAKEHNKEVRFEVAGGEIQADIALLDRLREPFIHLLRNSIAHGIEAPDERVKTGKNAEGRIVLEFSRERDSLFIKVADDGQGIRRSPIIKHLKEKGSLTDEQIARLSKEEFFNTILSPDFSSASETTDMAGRGVGMNVVAQAIEYLGGSMTITSEPSKGTEFIIKLPVSLSVIYAITFKIGKYTLSIPTSNVKSIDRNEHVSPEEISSLYDLSGLLNVNNKGKHSHFLKLRHLGRENSFSTAGGVEELAVEKIIGNRPLMVMPVGELLAKVGFFAGVGIMENGDISILLDIERLPEIARLK